MTATVKTVTGTVLAFFLVSILAYVPLSSAEPYVQAHVQSAAEVDWVPASDLDENQQQLLPWYCDGLYIQPEAFRERTHQSDHKRSNHKKPKNSPPNENQPIHVSARDALHVADHSTTFTGDVEIQQGSRRINSEFASMDAATDIATLQGPVAIRETGLLLHGRQASGNLFAGTGVIDGATFLLHQSRMQGSATQIHKKANNELLIEDGDFTRCNPGKNTWSMQGKNIRLVTDEGYGVARDLTIRVKNVPVAYFPYFRFPINDERQSGFLMPGIGQDSDGGTELDIPYYFNLAPHHDATYRFRSMWKRGLIHEAKYRRLTKNTNNLIDGAIILKDDIYDDRTELDLRSGAITPGIEKRDRWLVHATHDGGRNHRWKSSIRYSAVSDNDYLSDIGGSVGSASPHQMSQVNDRNLENRTTPALDRIGSISYHGHKWKSKIQVQGFQSLDDFALEQYEKLPELSVSYRDKYDFLTLDTKFRYTHFDRDTDNLRGALAITGQRGVVDATLAMPVRRAWGFVIPALNLIHRKYNLSNTAATVSNSPSLTTPSLSLDSGLVFDRFFRWRNKKFQQTLEPRLFYLYTEFDRQDDLPRFDASASTPSYSQMFRRNRFSGYDRIADTHQMSIGVSTSLLSADTGAEFLKASIGQIQYFKNREVVFQPKTGDDLSANSSALFTELRLALGANLSMNSSFEWEPRNGRSNRGKYSLKYRPDEYKIVNLSYSYTSSEVQSARLFQRQEESDLSFIWRIASKWSAIGRWNFGWDDDQTIESLLGVEYNDCCWKFRVVFRRFIEDPRLMTITFDDPSSPAGQSQFTRLDHRADSGIFLEFQLKGLAELGGRLDRLLEDSIPGYRARENRIGM